LSVVLGAKGRDPQGTCQSGGFLWLM
jgi:hypothetical protein